MVTYCAKVGCTAIPQTLSPPLYSNIIYLYNSPPSLFFALFTFLEFTDHAFPATFPVIYHFHLMAAVLKTVLILVSVGIVSGLVVAETNIMEGLDY